jgi:CheY-like chemotaxis protein
MCPSNLNREDPEAIRMVLQRLCHGGEPVTLAFGHLRGEFRILAETPDRVILALSDVERGQWGLKPGAKLTLSLTDRGLPFEAVVEFQGHGRFHGVEASHVSLPRLLRATEAHRLADYIPDRPVPCSYADHHSNVRDGLLQAFGMDGVELAAPEGLPSLSEVLRLHTASTVEFHAPGDTHFVLPVSVAYLGDRYWGLRFPEAMDPHLLGRYRQWLQEARRAQAQLDLKGFDPGGAEARETASRDLAGPSPHLHADRDPLILVLAEGEAFPLRLAAALGRKFGVAALDLARGNVRAHLADLGAGPEAGWGRVRLILVHRSVRGGSALEVCRRLVQEEQCPLPILIAGTEEEADLKRNRSISAGAVDYLVVEPFKVLSVLRLLDETLKLFE